jgi:hypothetical protein
MGILLSFPDFAPMGRFPTFSPIPGKRVNNKSPEQQIARPSHDPERA